MDQLTGGLAAEQPVVQEQPGGAAGGVRGGGVAGGLPVLVQPPGRGQRLVEGRAPAGGSRVAVPPAVGPLPADQGPGQGAHPRVGGQAEPAAGGQGVPSMEAWGRASPPITGIRRAGLASQARTRSAAAAARGSPGGMASSARDTSRQCAPVHLR